MGNVVDIELNVLTGKAMNTVEDFSNNVKEKMDFSNELSQSIDNVLNSNSNFAAETSPFHELYQVLLDAKSAVDGITKSFVTLGTELNGGAIGEATKHLYSSMYRDAVLSLSNIENLVTQTQNKLKGKYKSLDTFSDQMTGLRAFSASGKSSSFSLNKLNELYTSLHAGTDLAPSDLDSILPALRPLINKRASYYASKRGSAALDLNTWARVLGDDKVIQQASNSLSFGKPVTQAQIQTAIKAIMLSDQRSHVAESTGFALHSGLNQREVTSVMQQMPEVFHSVFSYYGSADKDRTANYGRQSVAQKGINDKIFGRYKNLVREGNQEATRLGVALGLVRANNGFYEFTDKATVAQMETLGGLLGQRFADAKQSLPFHWIHRGNHEQEEKLINRQNNVYQDVVDIMDVLKDIPHFSPDAYKYVKAGTRLSEYKDNPLFSFIESGSPQKTARERVKIKTLGTPDQFVIPSTYIGEDGKLVVRDPSWQKKNGVQQTDDDHFITIGESALTYMLGMHGGNTFGHGVDKEGKAVYKTPQLIRMSTNDIYKQVKKENGEMEFIVDPDKQAKADYYNRVFNREEEVSYGDTKYTAVYATDDGIILTPTDTFRAVDEKARERGISHIWDNLNMGSRLGSTRGEIMKSIELGRKMATPGRRISELGVNGSPLMAMIDYDLMYDMLGIPKPDDMLRSSERMDGMALFDPSAMTVNGQERMGLVNKFAGSVEDWKKTLVESGLMKTIIANKDTANGGKYRTLAYKGSGKADYHWWMPMTGLPKEELETQLSELNTLQNDIDNADKLFSSKQGIIGAREKQAYIQEREAMQDAIRNKYFYDIFDSKYGGLLFNSDTKNINKFTSMYAKDFVKMFGKNGVATEESLNGEIKKGTTLDDLTKSGRLDEVVRLRANQQARYLQNVTEFTGGTYLNNSAADFATGKDYIATSLMQAMGLSDEQRHALYEESNNNYNAAINALKTESGAIDFLRSTARGRRYLAKGGWNDSGAQALIQNRIKELEEKKSQQVGYFPNYGISSGLALMTSGTLFGNVAEKQFNARINDQNPYRQLFHYKGDKQQIIKGLSAQERKEMSMMTAQDREAYIDNLRAAKYVLSRFPAGPGQFGVGIENIAPGNKTLQNLMARLGMDYEDTVYTNPELQFRLMTGDYDGDTVWMIRGLQNDHIERLAYVQSQMDKAGERLKTRLAGAEEQTERKINKSEGLTEAQLAKLNTTQNMGAATAALRNTLLRKTDSDDKWDAAAEAIYAYDQYTANDRKKGTKTQMGPNAKKALMEGSVFSRFVDMINAYSADPNQPENKKVKPNLFTASLPDLRTAEDFVYLRDQFAARKEGKNPGSVWSENLDYWLDQQYGTTQTGESKAARMYGGMFKKVVSGMGLPDTADIVDMIKVLGEWDDELAVAEAAGKDVSEERGRWKSLQNQLGKINTSGHFKRADYENQLKDIESREQTLRKEAEAASNIGDVKTAEETTKKADELSHLAEGYRTILTPLSPSVQQAYDFWNEYQNKTEEERTARIQELAKQMQAEGIDPNKGMPKEMFAYKRIQGLDPRTVARRRSNWSYVEPFIAQILQEQGFQLSGIEKRDKSGNVVNQNFSGALTTYGSIEDNIREIVHDDFVRADKRLTEALPDRSTLDMQMGTVRHHAFENALHQIVKTGRNTQGLYQSVNMGDLYRQALIDEFDIEKNKGFQNAWKGLSIDEKSIYRRLHKKRNCFYSTNC